MTSALRLSASLSLGPGDSTCSPTTTMSCCTPFTSLATTTAKVSLPHTHTHARTSVSFIHVLCVCVRSAGTVMFEFGMRLGREVRTRLGLQKQVNCYLAALNCLRLIRPEYAWIVQPVSGATVHTHTHRLNLCDLSNSVVILFFVGVFPAVRASRCVSEEKL